MSVLMVPNDIRPWPTLGPLVCQFIEENLIFGPGDLRGQPARLDDEKRALIWRMYEVYPQGHPLAGRRRFKRAAISVRKGLAKALALDTPIPTPTGWTTMGEVQPGDYLLGSDGSPCRVLAVSPVYLNHKCYRVEFNDGTSIVADAGHLWYTQTRRNPKEGDGIFTTEQIRDTLYWHPSKPYSNHRIPLAAPLDLPEQDLPIDPYILGAWLGDGRNDDAEFTMDEADYPSFCEQVKAAGYYTTKPKRDTRRPTTLAVRVSVSPIGAANNNGRPTLKGALRDMGLLRNKHIPKAYLRSSFSQRLALFQGLMDTDGTVWAGKKGNPQCAYTTTRKELAEGVHELALTLGLRPHTTTGISRLYGKECGRYYKVGFTPRDDIKVFRLGRKNKKATRRAKKVSQAMARTIRAVEPVESVPVKCVAVDAADHLYLAGKSMIPTHNTELAAWVAACELHPEAPVRCYGFDKHGNPLGGPVQDPYIPLVAYTEEQSDELCYGALRVILGEGPLRDDFDIGLERIMRKTGDGKAVSLSSSPSARDGARTTFQVFDETHRFTSDKLIKAHQTMMANVPKRRAADAWSLEVTTAAEPGEGSVAENTMNYARSIADGKVKDAKLFFFHRQASDHHDLDTEEGARAAVIEASGPAAEWSDIDGIVELWRDPTTDRSYWERVWLNRMVKSSYKAFDVERWKKLKKESPVKPGDLIVLGFDGAQFRDSTGLVATHIETGFQWVLGLWECPYGQADKWQVPVDEVNDVVEAAFKQYDVWRMYADPPYWQTWVAKWAGEHGDKKVIEWWTNRRKAMSYALENFSSAIAGGDISHDGNEDLIRHLGNAYRQDLPQKDEDTGKALWLIRKERHDSPFKIDLAMAAVLSWEARTDAITAGALPTKSVYETRGVLSV